MVDSILLTATSEVMVALKYCCAAFTISFFWSAFMATAIQAARERRMLVSDCNYQLLYIILTESGLLGVLAICDNFVRVVAICNHLIRGCRILRPSF